MNIDMVAIVHTPLYVGYRCCYMDNYHCLLTGFKSLTIQMCVCTCLHLSLCVRHRYMYLCLCGFRNSAIFNIQSSISNSYLFPNSYFGLSLSSVCFGNSAWETQTYSKLLPLCLCFSYLHESSCVLQCHLQVLSCFAGIHL